MLREKAFDFWKTYIGLMTKGGVDVTMTNPAVTFTADARLTSQNMMKSYIIHLQIKSAKEFIGYNH